VQCRPSWESRIVAENDPSRERKVNRLGSRT
jgi:hypothetical protein